MLQEERTCSVYTVLLVHENNRNEILDINVFLLRLLHTIEI